MRHTPAHFIVHVRTVLQSNRQTKGEIYTLMRHNPVCYKVSGGYVSYGYRFPLLFDD
jgi:hypothetical protein